LTRRPWYTAAAVIFNLAKQRLITADLSATTVTDIFFLAQKDLGKIAARAAIQQLLRVFLPAAVTGGHIYRALQLEWDDFEDAVQFTVGESLSADFIVTRNTADFSSSSIEAVMLERFIHLVTDLE
jgi:hypothetical protein